MSSVVMVLTKCKKVCCWINWKPSNELHSVIGRLLERNDSDVGCKAVSSMPDRYPVQLMVKNAIR